MNDQVLVGGLCWLSYRWVIESLIVYQRRDRWLPQVDACACPRPVDGVAAHSGGLSCGSV